MQAWHQPHFRSRQPWGQTCPGLSAGLLPCRLAARCIVVAAPGAGPHTVMVVESPAKATKIQKFLGDEFKVLASYGHVRDLPDRPGSVQPEAGFLMHWQLSAAAGPRMSAIQQAVGGADTLLLATDPDREGEAISWHLLQELQGRGSLGAGQRVQRVTFTEITEAAVRRALLAPREVSQALVGAYLARRALDYLVGFNLSPLLWRKVQGARSAGRVQSAALRLVCDREGERERHQAREFWTVTALLQPPTDQQGQDSQPLQASLTQAQGEALPKSCLADGHQALALADLVRATPFKVLSKQSRRLAQAPPPPLITSTLQQEAARRLGFTAKRTMDAAQALYEGLGTSEGLITYMRTDGVQLSPDAVQGLREVISASFGPQAVSPQPRVFKSRAKNAQEAHEAIRPTQPQLTPALLPGYLAKAHGSAAREGQPLPSEATVADALAVYRLVWCRAVASQMTDAAMEQVAVELGSAAGGLLLRATGRALREPGYLQAWDSSSAPSTGPGSGAAQEEEEGGGEGAGEGQGEGGEAEGELGPGKAGSKEGAAAALLLLEPGQAVRVVSVEALQHFTWPPPRFTEASLIKELEQLGIGRPSTYASIMRLLLDRGYVVREGRQLVPRPISRVLSAFLAAYFDVLVDLGFTSSMEEQLDQVASGCMGWQEVLGGYWGPFKETLDRVALITPHQVYDTLDLALEPLLFPRQAAGAGPEAPPPRQCPLCKTGRLQLKPSRLGGFVGCSNWAVPGIQCAYARAVDSAQGDGSVGLDEGGEAAPGSSLPRVLGTDPGTGREVSLRLGPYGLYVQLDLQPTPPGPMEGEGEREEGAQGLAAAGEQGGKGKVKAGAKGRKKAPKEKPPRAPVPKGQDVAVLDLAAALKLLAGPQPLGLHPTDQQPVFLQSGRFGPCVRHGERLASLPKSVAPDTVDLDQAVELLTKKAAREAAKAAKCSWATSVSRGEARMSKKCTDLNVKI
ncbi:DNA topoisomerase I [Haematococcus lacustris]